MPATYEKIATTTLGSAATNITFSSIASSWTDLRIVLVSTVAIADNPIIRFNGDSATNYSRTQLLGNGSAATSSRNTSFDSVIIGFSDSTTIPTFIAIDIFSYAGSTYKTCLVNSNNDFNGSGYVAAIVGLWRSTSAITQVAISNLSAANFKAGTTATLYGILKA